MGKIWGNFREGFDIVWVTFLGVIGHVGIDWDTAVAKITSFSAMVILLFKLRNMFVRWLDGRKEKKLQQKTKQEVDDYEGD